MAPIRHVPHQENHGTGWFRSYHVHLTADALGPAAVHYRSLGGSEFPSSAEMWASLHPPLEPGSTDRAVLELQAEMDVRRTGVFDDDTAQALSEFKAARGLSSVPAVDYETWLAMLQPVPDHLKMEHRYAYQQETP